MEHKLIENLLEKYWEGKTSRSEERVLRDYFTSKPIPSHLQKAAALFIYYNQQKALAINTPYFEEELTRRVNKQRSPGLAWWKIAASILLVCASVFLVYQMTEQSEDGVRIVENTVAYEDPEKAYEETKKALLLVSAKLNTPEKYTSEIGKFNEAATLFK